MEVVYAIVDVYLSSANKVQESRRALQANHQQITERGVGHGLDPGVLPLICLRTWNIYKFHSPMQFVI